MRPSGRVAKHAVCMHDCAPVASSARSKPSFAATSSPSESMSSRALRREHSIAASFAWGGEGLKVDVAQNSCANASFSSTMSTDTLGQ